MNYLWVKYLDTRSVKIDTTNCQDVDGLIELVKDKLSNQLGKVDSNLITIHTSETALSLDPGIPISDIRNQEGYQKNTSKSPLIVKVATANVTPALSIQDVVPCYWKVSGTIKDSLRVKGVRSRMYRYADIHLGFYEETKAALFYDDEIKTSLRINVLFRTEENALRFESQLRNEASTFNSPMLNLTIDSNVAKVTATLGRRIFFSDYIPNESESPQETQSTITLQFSTIEETSNEFKFQRIEKFEMFGSLGKAESCHLMSSSHCKKYQTYEHLDKDPNNRLAMTRDLHGWFDGLNTAIPLFCVHFVSSSEFFFVEDRYKVELNVEALDAEAANMIFPRLNTGSEQIGTLVMRTSVYVTNPKIFRQCLEWKEKEITNLWKDYLNMNSAVP